MALGGVLAFAASCALFKTADTPRSGWNEEAWGPVLPHGSFPAECELCHVTNTWTEIKPDFVFDHEAETGVALLGAHADGACLRCHNDRGPVQQFAQLGCRGCHVDPHEGALGDRCASCHTERSWSPEGVTVMHLEVGFPLYGAHASTSCDQCHPNARSQDFRGAPTTCVECHLDDRQRATSPDHTTLVDCERCHKVFEWKDAVFPHDSFPLTGGHMNVACAQCHVGNVFQGTPRDCAACHQDDFAATTDPNHAAAGFSMQCESCHTIAAWKPSTFAHTSWPLTGAHLATACDRCHQNGVFVGTPRNCVDCHQPDYAATSNPNHTALGIPTTCEQCHATTGWRPASYAHDTYPLIGKHLTTTCNACHTNGVYAGTPRNCVDCHLGKYNATSNPNHTAAGFPTTCESCHTPAMWEGAVFNHTFDIKNGKHNNFACSQCHPNANDFSVFTCLTCHSKKDMDDHHLGKFAGYAYDSATCLTCHPTGHR